MLASMRFPALSKSRLLSSLQCPKRLWLEVNRRELSEYSKADEQRFTVGYNVGEIARQIEPGGVLIGSDENLSKALSDTRAQIDAGTRVLFEATFEYEGVLIRVDVLTRGSGGVRINEVKASTGVKDYHYKDAAFQAWVVEGCGLKLDSIAIQNIDNQFVYPGEGKYDGLFAKVPVDREIKPLLRLVPKWVAEARHTLCGAEPRVLMGKQCNDPYPCPFAGYCESLVPPTEFPLRLLPNAGRTIPRLVAEGYRDLRDIPEGRLSDTQERVRRAHVNGVAEFDSEVKKLMRKFRYPRSFLDFETVNFAVPIWKGVHPYQHIAFQWSLHVEERDGRTQHQEFLDLSGDLPAEPLVRALLKALPEDGPIFAYQAGFEKSCLGGLAGLVPAQKHAIERVQRRLEDLLPLTRAHYYHPDMEGSWSLTAVFPSLPAGKDYSDLDEVQEGSAAQFAYAEAITPGTTPARKAELEGALLKYCNRDTEALLGLSRFLQDGPQ